MPLSKLWLFILSFTCGLLALLIVSLGPELRRREADEQTQRLQRGQAVASQLLANQAHKLLAAAVQMGSDAVLQVSLAEMGRGQSELPLLHVTAQAQLKELNRDFGAALVLCTDARGRVLARLGHDEAVYRDPLDGFPLIDAALRGYRLDDLWLLDGVLYRVAASPVVAPGRDRYVGAVVVGQVVGSEILAALSRLTGLSALLLADGKIAASGVSGEPPDVQMLLSARALHGTTAAAPIGSATVPTVIRGNGPGPERLYTFVEMPGEAAQQGAVLVLVGEVTGARTLPGLLRDTVQRLQPTQAALGLFGAVAMVYVIGLAILRAERMQLYHRVARSLTPPPRPPVTTAVATPPPPAPKPLAPKPPAPKPLTPTPPPLPPPSSGPSLRLPDVGAIAAVSGNASAHSAETVVAGPILWEPEPEHDAPTVRAPLPLPETSTESAQPAPAETDYLLPPPNSNFEPTLVAGPVNLQAGSDPDASFYQVFQEYVMTRERCHESVEGISYEQFRQRLQESRTQIMQQHGCRGVDFQVYVKEGRAALRATPLWK